MTRIGSSSRSAFSSRTAWMRRIAGSPRLMTASRRYVRWVTEGTVGTLGVGGVSVVNGVPATPRLAGGTGSPRRSPGRAADLGRHGRDGRAQLCAQTSCRLVGLDERARAFALG